MAHESFEDDTVAEKLRHKFVAIKVDREERPDIDAVYMRVCQALTGGGGWPLTVFLTPDKTPFYAGTYFPKTSRYGQIGFIGLLDAITKSWKDNAEQLVQTGDRISAALSEFDSSSEKQNPDGQPVRAAALQLKRSFDPRWGGFGEAPKFPSPHNLMFLLRYSLLENDKNTLEMVEKTLQSMYRGGIFDHIGFGFSRYSTDAKWLAPHFEKMLYDNALITIALLECFQVTGNDEYKTAAEKTLMYISREMTAEQGAFFSAQDADSDGQEGKYYTFTPDEVIDVLGQEQGAAFCAEYDITQNGNFEDKSIPNRIGKSVVKSEPEEILEKLRGYRIRRSELHKDDKILTSWNALMIVALAKAYSALGDEKYLNMAVKSIEFIDSNLTDGGQLLISWREGKASGKGLLDDYAFLTWAFIEMYEATFDALYLTRAIGLAEQALIRFNDPKGGFFMSPETEGELIFRPKETYDGAIPSGNSVFALCLGKLAGLTSEAKWQEEYSRQLTYLYPHLSSLPVGHTFAQIALMEMVYPMTELVCVVQSDDDTADLIGILGKRLRPNLHVLVKTPSSGQALSKAAPFTQSYSGKEGERYTLYLCRNHSCTSPFFDIGELEGKLQEQR